MYNIERDSFVVVSDFHSNKWPLDKVIKYYINEYDKVYILGDATDRGEIEDGTGGLNLLFKIRELTKKYLNKVLHSEKKWKTQNILKVQKELLW